MKQEKVQKAALASGNTKMLEKVQQQTAMPPAGAPALAGPAAAALPSSSSDPMIEISRAPPSSTNTMYSGIASRNRELASAGMHLNDGVHTGASSPGSRGGRRGWFGSGFGFGMPHALSSGRHRRARGTAKVSSSS